MASHTLLAVLMSSALTLIASVPAPALAADLSEKTRTADAAPAAPDAPRKNPAQGQVPGGSGPVTDTPPPAFTADHDDPHTAEPPVPVPPTKRCTVTLVKHSFRDWDVHKFPYSPPTECGTSWNTVRLRLEGKVAGRQYDRLGWIDVNGVRVMTLSTPEPSQPGITWRVEKDLTSLMPVLRDKGETAMYLGNTVNETFTGVFDVTVSLDFFASDEAHPVAGTADRITPLQNVRRDGPDLVGNAVVPRNLERVEAEVYATGSGGGCEEFWDTSSPASTGYPCKNGLPYRQVDVLIDGKLAGIAAPYPYIYTGGWSNPFLWYAIPAPRAFNITPLRYDLTPFVGALNDGKPHEVRLSVQGIPKDGSGWTLSPSLHLWTTRSDAPTKAALVSTSGGKASIEPNLTGSPDAPGGLSLKARAGFEAVGWVETSHGRVTTTVRRDLTNISRHAWTAKVTRDDLDANWTDTQVVRTRIGHHRPSETRTEAQWSKKGYIIDKQLGSNEKHRQITTSLDIQDRLRTISVDASGKAKSRISSHNSFEGKATWQAGVPREQRVATGTSRQRYVTDGHPRLKHYERELATVNGYFTVDVVR